MPCYRVSGQTNPPMPTLLQRPVIRFNTQLLAEDMTAKGWSGNELARRAGVADNTVHRFLSGKFQTAKTAKALARVLGTSVRRYMLVMRQGEGA